MIEPLSEQQAHELLVRLVEGLPDTPLPAHSVRVDADRRRRHRRTLSIAAAAASVVLVVAGASTAESVLSSGSTTAGDGATSDSANEKSSPPSGAESSSDPQTLAALQGAWTLHLTNAAPDGQPPSGPWPDQVITFRGSTFQTTDGAEAIEGEVTIGPRPAAGEAGTFLVFDIRTASATPSPSAAADPPPVVGTLENLGRFEVEGNTLLLLARNSAITAVLRPRLPGIGRLDGTVRTDTPMAGGGLQVTLTPADGGSATTTLSDGDGGFGLDLPSGSYVISIGSGTCAPTAPIRISQFQTTSGTWSCPPRGTLDNHR